jgi:hypothetical protein
VDGKLTEDGRTSCELSAGCPSGSDRES